MLTNQKVYTERMLQTYTINESHLCVLFDIVTSQLHGNVETVQEVSTEHERVFRSVDTVNPPCGYRHDSGNETSKLKVDPLVVEEGKK